MRDMVKRKSPYLSNLKIPELYKEFSYENCKIKYH